MKKTLQEKNELATRLASYAVSTGALLALGSAAHGQVIYSGIQNLELNMPSEYLEIDLNGDLVNDFGFQMYGYSTQYTSGSFNVRYASGYAVILNPKTDSYNNSWITRLTTITYYGSTSTQFSYVPIVNGLGTGFLVDSSQTMWSDISYPFFPGGLGYGDIFSVTGPYSYISSDRIGDFFGQEKYIGVRFFIGTDQHYGWIRASLGDVFNPLTIIDWAYESTPGDGILTGAGDVIGPEAIIDAGLTGTGEQTINVSISFNEKAYAFDLSDIIVDNGSASNLVEIIFGLQYTFDVTANNLGEVTVTLPPGSVTDQIGNDNELAETSWIFDTTPPEVTLDAGLTTTHAATVSVDVTFNEPIQGLELSDFNVTNGTASNLVTIEDGLHYTVDITASSAGEVTVELIGGAVTDVASNENEPAGTSWTYAPPVAIDIANAEGIQIYPNPVSSALHVELEKLATVQIVDLNGKVVYRQERLLNETIDVSSFNPGVYIVQVQDNERVTQHKIIIE